MARVKICQTQATHSDRSLDMTDSGGKAERSIRKAAGLAFFRTLLLRTQSSSRPSSWLKSSWVAVFLIATFLATAFFAGFAARFRVRVAMLHVYQTWSLPYANDMATAAKKPPSRVQYRVGLGVTVSLLVAGAIALVAWASLANTHDAIVELTDDQVRELLASLDTRVHDHLQNAVTAVQLSEKLMGNGILHDDRDVLARHFTEVLRANPTFAWASYSDEMGDFTGAYRAPDGSLDISQTSLKVGAAAGEWERHYEADRHRL